jgi:hypothetical protein
MSTAQKTTEAVAVDPYEKMSVEQLRAELERLDEVCVKQEVQIRQFTEGTLSMITDFSGVILGHMAGDTDKVRTALDVIVNKYVTRVGDLH